MDDLYYRNLNYDPSIRPPFHQFSNAIFEHETTRTGFTNYSFYQPPTIHPPEPLPLFHSSLDETAIIAWTDNSELYNQPTNEDILEQLGRLNNEEETAIIGEAYDYFPYTNQPTYEENLELEERLGRVGSGLSEESIMGHLKITSYDATTKRMDEEAEICVICQGEYEKDELIGGLRCQHEYHVECIKTWLQQRNRCPICKADGVSPNA